MTNKIVQIYTDGATVGHNGGIDKVKQISIGIWIPDIKRGFGKKMAGVSNNEAEFQAIIYGMRIAKMLEYDCVEFRMDSKIIYNRCIGRRPKKKKFQNPRMDAFQDKVMELKKQFVLVDFTWIPRELNDMADQISKKYAKD